MADEIDRQNVVRVTRLGPLWYARIGPDTDLGVSATGMTGLSALFNLVWLLWKGGWIFDPSWSDRDAG